MRDTIKKHEDFARTPDDLSGMSAFFIARAKPAKYPDDARYGLVVTKKTFKHAVDRNRAKRLLRDWIAYNEKYMLANMDYVFIARHKILDATRNDGRDAMRKALHWISKSYKNGQK